MNGASLQSLSRRDVLIAHALTAVGDHSLASGLADSSALTQFLEALGACPQSARAQLRAALSTHAQETQRAVPIHPSWVEQVARAELPAAAGTSARTWLSLGGKRPASQQWLWQWCVARFPIGPTHVDQDARENPGHMVVFAPDLDRAVERLGLYALAIALSDAAPRRLAAMQALLGAQLRGHFLSIISELRNVTIARNLRLRVQSELINLQRRGATTDVLLAVLGGYLFGLACGLRFAHESRLLAYRLPIGIGQHLVRMLDSVPRRAPALHRHAMELVTPCLHNGNTGY